MVFRSALAAAKSTPPKRVRPALGLTIKEDIVQRARLYAEEKGVSLSRLIEILLERELSDDPENQVVVIPNRRRRTSDNGTNSNSGTSQSRKRVPKIPPL